MIFIEDILATIGTGAKLKAALRSKLPLPLLFATLPSAKEDDTVVILFTSGSEKDPKGVQLTHRNFSSNIIDLVRVFRLSEQDVMMGVLPLFHVFGHNANFWLPLIVGMTNVTVANPLEYKNIPKIIREEKPTMMAGTPIFFAGYLRESEPGDLASLRIVVPGADKTPDWLREGYRTKHGIELLEAYGTTETSPGVTVNTPEANRPGSIGRPFPACSSRSRISAPGLPSGRARKARSWSRGIWS